MAWVESFLEIFEVEKSSIILTLLEFHLEIINLSSQQTNAANVDSESNSSETHREENNSSSQIEMNLQIEKAKARAEMNGIETLLATLTRQVISRPEEGSALRASSSRTQGRVDNGIVSRRAAKKFSMKKKERLIRKYWCLRVGKKPLVFVRPNFPPSKVQKNYGIFLDENALGKNLKLLKNPERNPTIKN